MKALSYSSVLGNLMYTQVCTRPDISFVVGVSGKYLSDPGQSHWKAANKVLEVFSGYQGSHVDILVYRYSWGGWF